MDKHQWTVISSGEINDGEADVQTTVMEVPGGVMFRYRVYHYYSGSSSVALTFIPGAKISDFEKEQPKEDEE